MAILQEIQKYIFYGCILTTSIITLLYLWWEPSGELVKESTWSCTGSGLDQMCTFTNFCIDKENGPFIISSEEPPKINVINMGTIVGDGGWFQPKTLQGPIHANHINETLFVYGLYSPYHFSHFLYNGLMPLFSIMLEQKAPPTSWTLRTNNFGNEHSIIDMVLPSGKDIVLEEADKNTDRQVLPPEKPMCFPKAVVGLGNRGSLSWCSTLIPSKHYQAFKDYVLKQPLDEHNRCAATRVMHKEKGQYRVGILNRRGSRRITNVSELIVRLEALEKSKDGIDYSIVTVDFEEGCDIVNTANVVKDLDIMIAPFGNGLGAGLFMKNDSTLISVQSRFYSEDWFKYPMTAIGRRMFDYKCNSNACQIFEEDRATKILTEYGVSLNATEMTRFVTESYPQDLFVGRLEGWRAHDVITLYNKNVERRIDVDDFLPFLKEVMDRKPASNITFPESCKKDNVCCDMECGDALRKNVLGEYNAWSIPKK